MERIISSDERIRRAQEIYNRRKNQNLNIRNNYTYREKKDKKDFALFRKLIIQMFICLVIYICVYTIKNSNYIFSKQFLDKVNQILSYDIDLEMYYNTIINYFKEEEPKDSSNEQIKADENQIEQNSVSEVTTDENIGGAENQQPPQPQQQDTQNLSQMEVDSNNIKNLYNIIKPLQGKITSRFGQRDPTTPTVPKNHTGIDIAAATGTDIIAALDGIVELASSEGDYGNHLKIKKDDVEFVYAHCSKLLKKQGDEVKQGEVIAQVGATGNVTGPHLHFEIRKEGRYINPDLILDF